MKNYQLSEESINKVLSYLGSRPYAEVSELISLLFQSAALVEGAEEAEAVLGHDEASEPLLEEELLTEKGA